jgi:hypothetical protein
MSPAPHNPPRWAEVLLERLLPDHARETVVGDLREEFIESTSPQRGRLRANLWYLRHVASFVPWFAREGSSMEKLLLIVSTCALVCGGWLAVMETLLKHPGYLARIATALAIVFICAATIMVRMLHAGLHSERWLWLGAAALIWIGGFAFLRNAHSAHFEGFVFVISLILVLQGILMLATLGRGHSSRGRPLDPMAPAR